MFVEHVPAPRMFTRSRRFVGQRAGLMTCAAGWVERSWTDIATGGTTLTDTSSDRRDAARWPRMTGAQIWADCRR